MSSLTFRDTFSDTSQSRLCTHTVSFYAESHHSLSGPFPSRTDDALIVSRPIQNALIIAGFAYHESREHTVPRNPPGP